MNLQLQIVRLLMLLILIPEPFIINEVISERIKEDNTTYNYSNIIVFIILGLSIIANILLYIAVRNRNRKISKLKDKPKSDVVSSLVHNKLIGENKRLNNQLISLHNQLSTINIQNKTTDSRPDFEQQNNYNASNKNQPSKELIIENIEEKPTTKDWEFKKQEEIFLPSPFEDKRFTIEDVSKERTVSSLYKIVLNDNGITGKLLLLEDADFTRALNSPDHYLEKACRFENVFNPNAKGIDVVSSGSVKLENQDWFVIEKIKIKFI